MIKKIVFAIVFMFLLTFSVSLDPFGLTSASTTSQPIDDPTKPWTISFNEAVDASPQNLQKIYIQSANKTKLAVSYQLSADSKKVTVQPENPYIFGESYSLVIPEGVQSATGGATKSEVVKQFQMNGTSITKISAVANDFLTPIQVSGSDEVTKVTIASNFFAEEVQLIRYNDYFSKGIRGLQIGDQLTIHAYNRQGQLLERQTYVVK